MLAAAAPNLHPALLVRHCLTSCKASQAVTQIRHTAPLLSLLSFAPRRHAAVQTHFSSCRSVHCLATRAGDSGLDTWPASWQTLVSELWRQGYAGDSDLDAQQEWGSVKRAVLAFSRGAELSTLESASVAQLVQTDIHYNDRKVKNARERLALLGSGVLDKGTGQPTFQDVTRLLMAVELSGNHRTPDNEAAAGPVLEQVIKLVGSQQAPPPPSAQSQKPAAAAAAPIYWQPRQPGLRASKPLQQGRLRQDNEAT